MPEDELRQFWCLLDSDDKPFFLDANLKWNMDEMTEAIQNQSRTLRDLDTSYTVLWKLNEPIPVEPEETLLQRLPKLMSDFSVKLKRTDKVSDAFPGRPRENHLEIIAVTLFDRLPLKRRRLNSSEPHEVSEDLNLLWQTFWGKPASDCFVKDSTRRERWKRLCKEDKLYTEMLKARRLVSLTHSTIVAGQPGTGKTVGLSCILVWRLQEKKSTIYCSHKSYAYVFTNTGVQRVPLRDGNRIEALDESIHTCALVDVNPDLPGVPSQFRPSPKRRGRVVVATPPNPNHITIFKQDQGMTYYPPNWEWADLYCASLVRFSSVDPEKLRDAHTTLGGVPQRCFRALLPGGNELEMRIIQDAIDSIEDMQSFAQSTGSMPFKLDVANALIRLEPRDAKWDDHTTRLLSNHVARLVYEKIRHHETMKIRDSIESLLWTPAARGWGGQLFEIAVHHILCDGFAFEPQPMDIQAPPLRVKIKKAHLQAGGYFHKLSVRAERGSRNVGDKFLNQYLIPFSSTAETINAACISKDVTILFKMTVSPSNDLDLKGITELVDELPFNAKKRICIVFIVPGHDRSCKHYKRQSIIVPLGVPKNVSNPVVAYNQYVYYFPMDKL